MTDNSSTHLYAYLSIYNQPINYMNQHSDTTTYNHPTTHTLNHSLHLSHITQQSINQSGHHKIYLSTPPNHPSIYSLINQLLNQSIYPPINQSSYQSQAIFESNELRVTAKAWKGLIGYCRSMVKSSFPTRPN